MADFHGMPQALRRIAVEVALAVQARGAVPGELLRGGAVARQAGEEIGEQPRSKRMLGGNRQRNGPRRWRRARGPEAKKFASGSSISRRRRTWVM